MNLFEGDAITKTFPRSNFKLEIPQLILQPNTITGVVGENGNGKTTLLNIVAGEAAGEGKYQYFGSTVDQQSDWLDLKNDIGFIPQRIPRWYGSLEQNLILKAGMEGIPGDEIDDKLDSLLDFLGLQKYRHLKWTEISTGYRLRFELARILLGEPRLLVLDEPLANLDINTQQKFLSDLKALLQEKEYSIAVILSSQQLHEIESVADQMLFMRKGKSVYSGSLNAIAEVESSNLYEVQMEDNSSLDTLVSREGVTAKMVGPYTQIATQMTSNEFITELLKSGSEIRYFRNLSNSTKRFFNN